ncbi:MAG: glycosyltransferase family 2 protein [Planctomycetes bacterium]|nr:glycosyltransferase family 2 protein [Planctomycetota bacterium]
MTRPKLSVCVVAMNEEAKIADCLRSVDFADETIVVDSHSTDRTREIAASLGARVVERDWAGHVAQKGFALSLATHDWVLCLDADERVSPELRASILAALERDDLPAGCECARRTWYLGRWIRHGGWYPDRKLRLARRSVAAWTGVNPHDRLEVKGRVDRLGGDILHLSYDSISDHLRTIDSFTTIAAREKHAAGERAGFGGLILHPAGKFLRMYVAKRGFLDGVAGFAVAVSGAYYVFLKYAKLWEMDHGRRPPDGR